MSSEADRTPQEKYLFKPFFGSSHAWALAECRALPARGSLLDIGAGGGGMGRELGAMGFGPRVAVEIDPQAREHLKDAYQSVHASVDEIRGQKFNLILLLDVLEHMADPFTYLRGLGEFLLPGASILISVPNIAHWSVRFPLLFGYFEYFDRGLLDKTHLQFFTRHRFRRMLEVLPPRRETSISSSIEPLEFIFPQWFVDTSVFRGTAKARLALARGLPGVFAYQHLAHCRLM